VRLAFVFPDHTAHRPGALRPWRGHPAAAVLEEVEQRSGRDLAAMADEPDPARWTSDAQPAVLAASLVALRSLTQAGLRPDVVAGRGLGELTAAVAAGVLSAHDGATLATVRGAAMAAASEARPGGMATVLRLGRDAVEVIVDGIEDATIAADDAPGQLVVAGSPDALLDLRRGVRIAGGRVVPLRAAGAFHSPAMAAAVPRLAATLQRRALHEPRVPMISAVTADLVPSRSDVAAALVTGPQTPIRWREVQARLVTLGVTHVVEVGPGGGLAALAARTAPTLVVHHVAAPNDLGSVLDALLPLEVAV
jgi:[acyl-carrier-protein] S-malonyltransferase